MKYFESNNFSMPLFQTNALQIQSSQFGYEKCSANKPISHQQNFPEYSIHFIISGSGYISYNNGKKIKLKKNDIFFLLPQNDILYYPDKKNPWEYCWINFQGAHISQIFNSIKVSPDRPFISCKNKKEILKTFAENVIICKQNFKLSSIFCNSCCYKIIGLLLKNFQKNTDVEKKHPINYIDHAKFFIQSNLSNSELSLSMLAEFLHLNTSYLSRLFIETVGVSFNHYLSKMRIDKAVELFMSGHKSIKIVSQLCGFNSQYYFSTTFKKIHTIPPSLYIEQLDKKK